MLFEKNMATYGTLNDIYTRHIVIQYLGTIYYTHMINYKLTQAKKIKLKFNLHLNQ